MYEICQISPSSISHAFQIKGYRKIFLYFLIKVEKLYPAELEKDVRSQVKVFWVNPHTGENGIDVISLLQGDVILPLTLSEFSDRIVKIRANLVNSANYSRNPTVQAYVKGLENQGFTDRATLSDQWMTRS